MKRETRPRTPKHLTREARTWFEDVISTYELEPHHIHLLTLACEALDRAEAARAAIAKHGPVYTDQFGCPRSRPEIAVERDSRIAFARLLRELDLDTSALSESSRPPAIRSNRR